jgi:hypothetical protein
MHRLMFTTRFWRLLPWQASSSVEPRRLPRFELRATTGCKDGLRPHGPPVRSLFCFFCRPGTRLRIVLRSGILEILHASIQADIGGSRAQGRRRVCRGSLTVPRRIHAFAVSSVFLDHSGIGRGFDAKPRSSVHRGTLRPCGIEAQCKSGRRVSKMGTREIHDANSVVFR